MHKHTHIQRERERERERCERERKSENEKVKSYMQYKNVYIDPREKEVICKIETDTKRYKNVYTTQKKAHPPTHPHTQRGREGERREEKER